MDVCKRLAYIQQMSELLVSSDPKSMANHKLVSFYGYLMREISMKNQIHSIGSDLYKRKRCKKCYSLIDSKKFKIKKKFLVIRCQNCGHQKRTKIEVPLKTHYEKCLHSNQNQWCLHCLWPLRHRRIVYFWHNRLFIS